MNEYWSGGGIVNWAMRAVGNAVYDVANALTSAASTPEQLQRAQDLKQLRQSFSAARSAGDIATMQNLQIRHAQITSAEGNPSMLQVSMASDILRAQTAARANVDRNSLGLAAGAAITQGFAGMVTPKVINGTGVTLGTSPNNSGLNAPTFSRLAPGGGLQVHEDAGGHLISKHIGKAELDLRNRLNLEPGISGSSSFYNRVAAEDAASQVLDANQSKISNWLNGNAPRLRLDQTLAGPAGISVMRNSIGAVDAGSARLILVRDQNMPNGYKILTGYPTLP